MSDPITRMNAALEGCYRIESQLGEVRAAFAARGIEPGSDLALRLFA